MIDIVFDMHFISSIRINVVKLCHIQKDTSQDLSQFMTGMGSMKATLYNDIREIHVQEVEYVPPGPGYLTLDTRCTGICGSDLHNYFGQWKPDLAVAQGHEVCGEVAEIGKGVTGFRVGDLVTLECFSHCGDCLYCRKGWYNHCLNRSWFAPGVHAGFAEYATVHASSVYQLEDMTFEEGTLVAPLAVSKWRNGSGRT